MNGRVVNIHSTGFPKKVKKKAFATDLFSFGQSLSTHDLKIGNLLKSGEKRNAGNAGGEKFMGKIDSLPSTVCNYTYPV
jgi:hypothetical protein